MGFNSGFKGLTFNNCTLCPHCIYVFCVYLRTNSDLRHLQPSQAKPSQAKVLTGGGDLREAQVDVPLSVSHLQHKLIGFYNRDEKCLQLGTDWIFK